MTNSNKPHITLPNGDVIHECGYGVTRDGQKVGPIIGTDGEYPFTAWFQGGRQLWDECGVRYGSSHQNTDIIAAWVDDTKPTKPAKDQNRPRPAHKLNLRKGDVVRHVGWQDDIWFDMGIVKVGEGGWLGNMLQLHIDTPLPKGQRPLFVVVSRAKPTRPTDARNRLAFAENAMLEDGMTPAQIRDHMRRYADVIDGQICGMEGRA